METAANFLSAMGTITFETFCDTAIPFLNNYVDWETLNHKNQDLYFDWNCWLVEPDSLINFKSGLDWEEH